jgi:hypothetical protein
MWVGGADLRGLGRTPHVHLDGRTPTGSRGGIPTANRDSLVDRVKQPAGPADGGAMSTLRSPKVGR